MITDLYEIYSKLMMVHVSNNVNISDQGAFISVHAIKIIFKISFVLGRNDIACLNEYNKSECTCIIRVHMKY